MRDSILLAHRNLKERKTRSILMMLGIAVGIAAAIALISISYGMQEAVTEQLLEMGDTIMVLPGEDTIDSRYVELGSFTERDVEDVRRISGVKAAAAMMTKIVEVEYRGSRRMVEIVGADSRDLEALFGTIVKTKCGRYFRDNDHKTCDIGYRVAADYFGEEIAINERITINGTKFKVVGILEKQGRFRSEADSQIYVTTRDAEDILTAKEISVIFVRVDNLEDAEKIATEIEERIDENHKLDDFTSAMTMGSAIGRLESVFAILQAVLLAIASISLLVAAIGTMNTMLVAVVERTREIGIMKAIGAKNRNILMLYLLEGGLVSATGGLFGCLGGVVIAHTISYVIRMEIGVEVAAVVKPDVLLGGIAVAIMGGVLSALFPAWQASKMSPVEAVRTE